MTATPDDLPDLLRAIQSEVNAHADNLPLLERLNPVAPHVAFMLRGIVLKLQAAIDEAEDLREAARGPSKREMAHRLHMLRQAGVVTPHAWWGPMLGAAAGSAA